MNLLEFYGFQNVGENHNGEFIFERPFSSKRLVRAAAAHEFDLARMHYPRFLMDDQVQGFGIPIKEEYHDVLYPDLWNPRQADLFGMASGAQKPARPGNTIRKVYLCRARSRLGNPGSILFFYKGVSTEQPSQAMTAIGVLESLTLAHSKREVMQLTGGRSVYSEAQLAEWEAASDRPVKVINYLLVSYVDPPIGLDELRDLGVVAGHPQQSIYKLSNEHLKLLVERASLDFET